MSPKLFQQVAISLPVFFLREKRTTIAYTPALDLSASGSTAARAKKNFETALRLFLEELVERGTLDEVLREQGWSKHERQWQPPLEVERTGTLPVRIPVPAWMPKLAPVPWEKFERFLLRVGCVLKRREPSHRVYWKEGLKRPIVLQAKGNVPVFIILNNLRTLGVDREDYLTILKDL
jgi:predicted RNA binding protein YcfA (HicA-like mRNA interferase family)